jgi:hypothetical protein
MGTSDAEGKVDDSDKTKVFDEAGDKGKTFRKRRLSVTKLQPLDNDSGDDDDVGENVETFTKPSLIQTELVDSMENANSSNDKAHTFRKRRLSLTSNSSEAASSVASAPEEQYSPANFKRLRKSSDASASTSCSINAVNSRDTNLQSKTLHAAEILSPSPSDSAVLPKFYQQAAPPQQLQLHNANETKVPKWKERHVRPHEEDDKSLPFPRDVVGTFSCHGVEPIYDDHDSYLPLGCGGDDGSPGNKSDSFQSKLTMAAKINQDRGGVAFPYGNSRTTALFAVYDGTHLKFTCNNSLLA